MAAAAATACWEEEAAAANPTPIQAAGAASAALAPAAVVAAAQVQAARAATEGWWYHPRTPTVHSPTGTPYPTRTRVDSTTPPAGRPLPRSSRGLGHPPRRRTCTETEEQTTCRSLLLRLLRCRNTKRSNNTTRGRRRGRRGRGRRRCLGRRRWSSWRRCKGGDGAGGCDDECCWLGAARRKREKVCGLVTALLGRAGGGVIFTVQTTHSLIRATTHLKHTPFCNTSSPPADGTGGAGGCGSGWQLAL